MRPKSPRTSKSPSPGGITIAVMNPRSASRADSRSASSSGAELGERVAVGEESVLQRAQHAPFQFLTRDRAPVRTGAPFLIVEAAQDVAGPHVIAAAADAALCELREQISTAPAKLISRFSCASSD